MGSIIRSDVFIRALERKDKQLLEKVVEVGRLNGYHTHDTNDGYSILHIAAGHPKCPEWLLRKLLKSGADPNAAGYDGMTPTHISGMWGKLSNLITLIEHGADLDRKNIDGCTVFDLLHDYEHFDCLAAVQRHLKQEDCHPELCDVSSGMESLLNTAHIVPNRKPRNKKELFSEDLTPTDVSYASTRSTTSSVMGKDAPCDLETLTDREIQEELKAVGEDTPQISDFTRNFYLHNLAHLKLGSSTTFRIGSQSCGTQHTECCEVIHHDPDHQVVLREVHYPSEAESSDSSHAEEAIHADFRKLSDDQIFAKLRELGDNPGPVNSQTRNLYLRRLTRRVKLVEARTSLPSDIHFVIAHIEKLPSLHLLEQEMESSFKCSNKTWREGNTKTCFNYILLDSRVTQNLPLRAHHLQLPELMTTFVKAIFYVGKGKRARPYSHLMEALSSSPSWMNRSEKVKKIQHIWADRQGVVSLHVFQNVIPVEAYTREACMIEAIGVTRLTNVKRGDCYGVVGSWPEKKRKRLGAYLIYKALQIFLSEGERHLGPLDF
ncbi:ankyrin repeat and LEM domain-containing protein 1-like [Ornithodoros turicata]|uniref:ankyrin repeat and LEM domain-containing protein 1-like n=1 Tax=Ornithodoros turicata TaxID=34597 RepID=UPI0031395AA8